MPLLLSFTSEKLVIPPLILLVVYIASILMPIFRPLL